MQNSIISQSNTTSINTRSITELKPDEIYGISGGSATTRHFAFGMAAWSILMGTHGIPSLGFAAVALATPGVFAAVDVIHHWDRANAIPTYAKKFNFGALMCLTLGAVLTQIPGSYHITNNVFTGFNISNPE